MLILLVSALETLAREMLMVKKYVALIPYKPDELWLSPTETKIVQIILKREVVHAVEIKKRLGKTVKLGTIYVSLNRLERKGILISSVSERQIKASRGGKRRTIVRNYQLAPGIRRAV